MVILLEVIILLSLYGGTAKSEPSLSEIISKNENLAFDSLDNRFVELENDLKSGCAQISHKLLEIICASKDLSYFNRNFYYLFSIGKNNLLGDKWTSFSTREKWEGLVLSNKVFLSKLSKCSDEGCIGDVFTERACYVRDLRFNNFKSESPTEEGLVFHRRVAYNCHSSGGNWNSFLKLTGPYVPKTTIKDIEFSILSKTPGNEETTICEEFVELLNHHKNKEDLRCGLPSFKKNSNFERIGFIGIEEREINSYKKFLTKPKPNFINTPELAVWTAYYSEGFPDGHSYTKNLVTIRRPMRNSCLWDETGNPEYTTAWSKQQGGFLNYSINDVERSRLNPPSNSYFYETLGLYPLDNNQLSSKGLKTSGEGQLFKYKGVTYLSTYNRSIVRYGPPRWLPICKIKSNVNVN